jgi:membrane protease YdiL (CAAX protease family)
VASPNHAALAVVLGLVALISFVPMAPRLGVIAMALGAAMLTAYAWRHRLEAARALGVVVTAALGMLAIPQVWAAWPLPLLAALGMYAVLARGGQFGPPARWWRRGTVDGRNLLLAAGFAVVASIALVAWWKLTSPDLSDLRGRLPAVHPALLVAGAVVFSMANALAEEAMWRGLITDALARTIAIPAVVLVIQAASFGFVHYRGFPRGLTGVGLAMIYGLMMGELRRRSDGLLVPWLAHIIADLTIVAVVVLLASS